jgi:hypothetical protein
LNRVGIVGARCLIVLDITNGENERKFETIGCERSKIDGTFVVCGDDFI